MKTQSPRWQDRYYHKARDQLTAAASYNQQEQQRLQAWIAAGKVARTGRDVVVTRCPWLDKPCYQPRPLIRMKPVLTIIIDYPLMTGWWPGRKRGGTFLPGLEPRSQRRIAACCVRGAYEIGRARRRLYRNDDRFPVHITYQFSTDTARQEAERLFGAAPCWQDD